MLTTSEIQGIHSEILIRSQKLFQKNANRIKFFLETKSFKPNDMVPLIAYTVERADMVMFLSKHGNIEDAEIIFRSMLESFIKFIYTLSEDINIVNDRIKEYWQIIGLHEKKRRSDMLKRMYNSDMIIPEANKKGVLTAEEEKEIENHPDYRNRAYRTKLKESWSFAGMIKSIEAEGTIKAKVLTSLTALSQHYNTASHIAHADNVGIENIRSNRLANPYHSSINTLYQLLKLLRITNETVATLAVNLYGIARDENSLNRVIDELQAYCDYSWSKNIILRQAIDESTKP
jgi:hypothetical protein